MKVSEVMSRELRVAGPDTSLREAARMMAEADSGLVLIGEDDRLQGTITDRDMTVRGIAAGLGADAAVGELMTGRIRYCYEDADLHEAARNMIRNRVRRLPVLNRDKRLVGVISMGDLAGKLSDTDASDLLRALTAPEDGRLSGEAELDEAVAETFPASDPIAVSRH